MCLVILYQHFHLERSSRAIISSQKICGNLKSFRGVLTSGIALAYQEMCRSDGLEAMAAKARILSFDQLECCPSEANRMVII